MKTDADAILVAYKVIFFLVRRKVMPYRRHSGPRMRGLKNRGS